MSNRTKDQDIVRLTSSFAPVPGHALVIVDQRGGGAQHKQTVMPGEKVELGWSGRWRREDFAAYRVRLDEQLRDQFVRHEELDGHAFSLVFEIQFRVLRESAHVITLRLGDDPLGRVEEEIKRVLGAAVRNLPWSELAQTGNLSERLLLQKSRDDSGDVVSNEERLRVFARALGIDLRVIIVTRTQTKEEQELARGWVDVTFKQTRSTQKIEENRIEAEEIRERARLETRAKLDAGLAQVPEAFLSGATEAVHQIARGASSIRELKAQAQDGFEAVAGIERMLSNSHGEGRLAYRLPAQSESNVHLLGDGGVKPAGIRGLLTRACDVAESLPNPEDRRELVAALLHVIVVRLTRADTDELERAKEQLRKLYEPHMQSAPDEHLDFVNQLRNSKF